MFQAFSSKDNYIRYLETKLIYQGEKLALQTNI